MTSRAILKFAPMALLLVGFANCATTYKLVGTHAVPAAQGEAKATIGDNGNTRLELSVKHLGLPGKVSPGASVYVVWVVPETGGAPSSIGALEIDKDLNGSLKTVTPLRSFTLTITAEPSPQVAAPSGTAVLSAKIVAK